MLKKMSQNIHGTFVSEKISKIRWRPDQFNDSNKFISGSWDNIENSIKLWGLVSDEEDNDIYPEELQTYTTDGDVSELKFATQDLVIASTSAGSIILLEVVDKADERYDINEKAKLTKLHKFDENTTAPCTGFSNYEEDVVSIGEDGRLNLLNAKTETIVRTIENADSCSLHCVTFLKHNEVLTSNVRGQMKIWDLRASDDAPKSMFMLNGDQITATCLTYHPTQRHMVLAGDEEGSLTVWDLRQNTFPVTLLSAHSEAVTEIQFHPSYPDHMFSCSNSGELWHWSTVNQPKQTLINLNTTEAVTNPWFNNENIKNKLEVFSLMPKLHKPVNCLDLERNKLLCGCDNEAIYLINNLNVM